MRRLVSLFIFLAVFAVMPLAAQDDGPHVYDVNYINILDSKYMTYLQEVLFPVWDEFVNRGIIISYHVMRQYSGAGESDIIGITEFPNWDGVNELTSAAYNEVSQAVHGMSWADVNEEYWPLSEIRTLIRTEIYGSAKP